MKITVDNQVYNSKKEALKFFASAIRETDGSEQDRMVFAYESIKDGFTLIDTYDETAKITEEMSLEKLMTKVNRAGVKYYIPIFKNWAKSGKRTLEELTAEYIKQRFGVSDTLATSAAKEFLSNN